MKQLIIKLANWAYDEPFSSLIAVTVLSVTLALGLGKLSVDSSNEGLFQNGDPVLASYTNFQRQFGRDDIVVAAIRSECVFSSSFMEDLRTLHNDLENNVPWLDDVTSIANADWMKATSERDLKVSELGREWPAQGSLSKTLQQEILSSSLYRDTLISSDGQMTLIAIRALAFNAPVTPSSTTDSEENFTHDFFQDAASENANVADRRSAESEAGLSDRQLAEFITAIEIIVKKYRARGLDIHLAGGPLLDKRHHDAIHHDAWVLVLTAIFVILVSLYALFRTKTAVLVPVLIILLALASIMGVMGWLNIPVTPVSQALPPLILMAGVLDSVHLLGLYYVNRRRGAVSRTAIINAIGHSGLAIFFTSLTTAAGFLAFTVARMKPIAEFGWTAAVGIMLVFMYTLLLLPALIRLGAGKSGNACRAYFWQRFSNYMYMAAKIGMNHPYKVLLAVALVFLLAMPGVMNTRFSYDVLSWFPEDASIRVDTLAIDNKIRATVPLEIIIDTGVENGLLTPEFMRRLRIFQDYAESIDGPVRIGRATSIVDVLQRIDAQLNNSPLNIPQHENLIHQQMLLYEGGGAKEIARLVDRQYSKARITLRLAWADGKDMVPLREKIRQKAVSIFTDAASVEVTGTVDLVATGAIDLIKSMVGSYLFAAVSISLMLILLWRSWQLGLLAVIPNFATIYLGVAVMGYLGMTMNMITVLLGGIALGLAVDDTVHLINGIQQKMRYEQTSLSHAVESTLAKIGPILVITSLVLSAGFAMFAFSTMTALGHFGILLSLVILIALIFDVLVVPALIKVFGNRIIVIPAREWR